MKTTIALKEESNSPYIFPSLPKPYLGILCLFLSFSLGFSPRSDALFIVEIKERGSEGRSEEAEGDKRMRGISTSI